MPAKITKRFVPFKSNKVAKVQPVLDRKPLPPPSVLQQDILDFIKATRKNLVVQARAGSGKTTSVEMIVREIVKTTPDESVLVAAFSRDIKLVIEARLADLKVLNNPT